MVNEVKRRGILVVVAADEGSLSDDLKRATDRYYPTGPKLGEERFPTLKVNGREWKTA